MTNAHKSRGLSTGRRFEVEYRGDLESAFQLSEVSPLRGGGIVTNFTCQCAPRLPSSEPHFTTLKYMYSMRYILEPVLRV